MGDITTTWDPVNARGDWAIVGGAVIHQVITDDGSPIYTDNGSPWITLPPGPPADLASGDDLETAVLISVFSDARAADDDVLPPGVTDRRGWWGDPNMGSKIWLLRRSILDAAVVAKARDYLKTALQWLLDDGVAFSVTVTTWQEGLNLLGARIVIKMSNGTVRNFAFAWAWAEI
jgi:phage gp46-like protein